MRKRKITVILIVTLILGIALAILYESRLIAAVVLGVIVCSIAYFIWNQPKRHREFSDSDRLKATSRALGGSGPPELWTPDMPSKKKRKSKRKS